MTEDAIAEFTPTGRAASSPIVYAFLAGSCYLVYLFAGPGITLLKRETLRQFPEG